MSFPSCWTKTSIPPPLLWKTVNSLLYEQKLQHDFIYSELSPIGFSGFYSEVSDFRIAAMLPIFVDAYQIQWNLLSSKCHRIVALVA